MAAQREGANFSLELLDRFAPTKQFAIGCEYPAPHQQTRECCGFYAEYFSTNYSGALAGRAPRPMGRSMARLSAGGFPRAMPFAKLLCRKSPPALFCACEIPPEYLVSPRLGCGMKAPALAPKGSFFPEETLVLLSEA
ncbi:MULTISPECIES: hypothetical protein [unclassified Bradyrhizobium]|uniref:hypothetical protein n=1 Tax=unclassified Bradyrhizobium TaxID=2631580 RepID=UPI0035143AC5